MMSDTVLLVDFFKAIEADPRINSRHISLYASLFQQWAMAGFKNPVEMFSREAMSLCKISASSTYHKTIKELHEFGYIKYDASFNHHKPSSIYIVAITDNYHDTNK